MVLPSLTLRQVFAEGCVYNPRPSYRRPGWLPGDRSARDFIAGGQLTVAGPMALLCPAVVATDRSLELLRACGMEVSPTLVRYASEADYYRALRRLAAEGRCLALQHVHPDDELDPGAQWIPPDLVRFLNNKANLGRLVPAGHVPERRIVAPEDLPVSARPTEERPVVIKAASDLPSSGGHDVRICRDEDDVQEAARFLAGCAEVVVEGFLTAPRTFCVQFAAPAAGGIRFLGAAEQVCDERGSYHGNWLEAGPPPGAVEEVGRTIMQRAVAMGYRGFAGFDMAVDEEGHPWVFDLNFRINGSTPMLLLMGGIHAALGPAVLRSRSWSSSQAFEQVAATVLGQAERQAFLPLCVSDPAGTAPGREPVRLAGIVLGASRPEVARRERELRRLLDA